MHRFTQSLCSRLGFPSQFTRDGPEPAILDVAIEPLGEELSGQDALRDSQEPGKAMEPDLDIEGNVHGQFDELPGNGRTRERQNPGTAEPGRGFVAGTAEPGTDLGTGHLTSRDNAPPGKPSTPGKRSLS